MTSVSDLLSRGTRRVLTVALPVLATGSAVAVAQLAGSDTADPGQRPNPELTAVQPEQAASFAVLRGEAGSSATLSSEAAALLSRQLTDDVGASDTLSRFARTGVDGEARYVVPGRGWICLVSAEGRGGCNRTPAVVDGYGLGAYRTGNATVLEGLVPDGVPAVEVTGAGGASSPATVQANVWTASVTFTPTAVRWTGADNVLHEVPVGPVPEPGGPPPGG
jgi:hypothetical protein